MDLEKYDVNKSKPITMRISIPVDYDMFSWAQRAKYKINLNAWMRDQLKRLRDEIENKSENTD